MRHNHCLARTTFMMALYVSTVCNVSGAMVTTPRIFNDHMVLQRGKAVPVWGTASPGEIVTVTFAGHTVRATADASGSWNVRLAPMTANATGQTLTVAGDTNTLTMTDVLVGDVWLVSGQSNAGFPLAGCNRPDDIQTADFPAIRHIGIPNVKLATPAADFPQRGWNVCTPLTAKDFTAIGFYFARKVNQETGVPIGLINSSWSGSAIEPWIAPEGLTDVPELKDLPVKDTSLHVIYNGMIHPLAPYGIAGALWYQGEANGAEGDTYFFKMRALIEGWRTVWGDDFPFYLVQLASFGSREHPEAAAPEPGGWWTKLRIAQANTLAVPRTGMALAIDIGDDVDIHPKNKKEVGERLALWALKNEYGRPNIVCQGPMLKDVAVEGARLRLSFDGIGAGLMVGKIDGIGPAVEDVGGTLKRFAVAGATGGWHWADAVISENTVVVSSPNVAEPRKVRYAFKTNPWGCNLYNKDGLPAVPFNVEDVTKRFDITSSAGTHGSITPDGVNALLPKSTALYSIKPDKGFFIQDVLVDGTSVGSVSNYTFGPLASNHTLSATFSETAPTYPLTITAGTGGTCSPSGTITVAQGASQRVAFLPQDGYRLLSVTADGVLMGKPSDLTLSDIRKSHTVTASFEYDTADLALKKPITASSTQEGGFPTTHANDGNPATRWSSTASDPQWISVDLETPAPIYKVGLRWEVACGKDYLIQVSDDGSSWSTVYTRTNGVGGSELLEFTPVTCRYVRIYGTARGTPWGYSLWDLEVWAAPPDLGSKKTLP